MAHDDELTDAASASPEPVAENVDVQEPSELDVADAEAAAGAETTAEPEPERRKRRLSASSLLVLSIVAVALAAVFVIWLWASTVAPVPVPALVSMTPVEADKVLRDAQLTSGKATYEVTGSFPAGVIIAQSPVPYVRVPRGSAVNVRVVAAPKPIVVPDVAGLDSGYARALIEYRLLRPVVLYAYSKDVRANSVIEQLPRAGDTAVTGSVDVLVVSLGPGVPGTVVPAMKGKPFAEASKIASAATLFAQPRTVIATGTPAGVVVDQAPTAGLVVPVGTVVWVSVAVPAE
jgi:beta-lactam-binding protein with PASTA domain